jgi:hypothetical protein
MMPSAGTCWNGGAMAETEAPASRRKLPVTATPSTYSHRARRRLFIVAEELTSLAGGVLLRPIAPESLEPEREGVTRF